MLVKVQDTKRPNRDPFETSAEGFQDLQRLFGHRYKALSKVIVTQEKIVVTQGEFATPAKAKGGK